MQRAICVVLLVALVAPAFPSQLVAQETASTTEAVSVPEAAVESVAAPVVASTIEEVVQAEVEEVPAEPALVQDEVAPVESVAALRAAVLETPGGLLPGEYFIVNQDNASQNIEHGGAVAGEVIYLEPGARYTALVGGEVSKVRLYLARNNFPFGTFASWGVRVFDEAGLAQVCSLVGGQANGATEALRNNLTAVPVGDSSAVVLLEFDEPEGNCVFEAGTTYTFKLFQQAGIHPDDPSSSLYTKGSNGTDFFLQIIGGEPIDPPTCTENCFSSVLFLPGIQGSALKEGEELRWPSSLLSEDVSRLALTESGESVNDIEVAGVIGNFVQGIDIYGDFSAFMNGLVADETINEWVPYAYDWRMPLTDTLDNGSEQQPGGEAVRLVPEIERLAAHSKSGQVTIVAHSMGGLLGKLLIQRLEAEGKEDLIDNFVMVGTPQLGTPQAAATLLHGHQKISMEFFSRSHVIREIGQNMETTYDLLPSERYFSEVVDPVISFNESADFTEAWRERWGETIDSYSEFSEFVKGTGVIREDPELTNLAAPEVLRQDLYTNADVLHDSTDAYVFPSDIRVVQIAGWGLPTLKGIEYKKKHVVFDGYDAAFTTEGDNTVVYPSAHATDNQEQYYFNLATYNALEGVTDHEHRNLIGAQPVQTSIDAILKGGDVTTDYFTTIKPDPGSIEDRLLVSTKSPVVLGAYDAQGNFTGINPDQNLTAETLPVEESIPGSTFMAAGEDLYLFLPKNSSYSFVFKGTGNGPATVEVATFSNDSIVLNASYTDIPVTLSTKGTFTLTATSSEAFIAVDNNGDGQTDTVVVPDGYVPPPTLIELIASLKVKIQTLDVKPKLKEKLLNKVAKIEKKISKKKDSRATKVVMSMENKISKKAGKGKISGTDAEAILELLEQIEAAL